MFDDSWNVSFHGIYFLNRFIKIKRFINFSNKRKLALKERTLQNNIDLIRKINMNENSRISSPLLSEKVLKKEIDSDEDIMISSDEESDKLSPIALPLITSMRKAHCFNNLV